MATTANRKLNAEEKTTTRDEMNKYKASNPEANLYDVQENLKHLAWHEHITIGVLRGLSRGVGEGSGGGRPRGSSTTRKTTGVGRGRGKRGANRPVEKVIVELNALRRQRDGLDAQIGELEEQIRRRIGDQLAPESAGRIFGNMLKGIGDVAGRVTERVGDVAGRVTGRDGDDD